MTTRWFRDYDTKRVVNNEITMNLLRFRLFQSHFKRSLFALAAVKSFAHTHVCKACYGHNFLDHADRSGGLLRIRSYHSAAIAVEKASWAKSRRESTGILSSVL